MGPLDSCGVGSDGDGGASVVLMGQVDDGLFRLQTFRGQDGDVDTQDGSSDQEGIGHIVAAIASIDQMKALK